MSQSIRTVLTAVAATVALACLTAPAFADTPWQANHPARVEVNHRLANQAARISAERRAGEISARKAHRLRVADRHILRQERRMARMHGGHLTRAQVHRLNREENKVSGRIG